MLTPIELKFWNDYLKESKLDPHGEYRLSASPAGNSNITDELIELYLCGKKRAGSSIVEDFTSAGDPLPAVGDYWILLDSHKKPVLLLKTVRTVINRFKSVPLEIALAEGEGDLSLEYWKRVHAELYTPHLKQWGLSNLDEAHVITEFFEIIYRA